MNLSRGITQLKMQLGLYNITLPFKDPETGKPIPVENVIRDVLVNVTIPEYSQFQPWLREVDANINSLKVIDKKNNIYLLPAGITITQVIYVSAVHMPYHSNRGTYGDIAPAYGISQSVQGVATSQAMMMVAGQMRSEPTFDYMGENKIKLFGYPKCVVTFKVACEHEPNGETIPQSCYDSFMELATLDMKMFLYNTLKMYDNIPTAFGNINLKIDDLQSAEESRNTLLDKWRDTFHLDMDWEQFM
jgi:hypothetical protein